MDCASCGQANRQGARFCDGCGAALIAVVAPSLTPDAAPISSQPLSQIFVGREDEIARLSAALDATIAGRGRLITLVGEPGIGKTRTARQLESAATVRGAIVLWGRCHEESGAPPFWPWTQSIRAYVRAADPAELQRDLGPGAPDVAEVIPDVRLALPDIGTPPALDPDQARFRFFDSVAAFLTRASARRPLVIILDNLHWADRPSLLLLEFLAPELPRCRLLVVGTYRDTELSRRHPLAQSLGELAKEHLYDPIRLRGLDRPDVGVFLSARTGMAVPNSIVDAIWRQTEGNPLFLTELARLLEQDNVLGLGRSSDEAIARLGRIPEGVREVIGRRLDRLPTDSNRVLGVASLIGREFAFDLLLRLLPDLDSGRVKDFVEAAVEPGLIEALPGAPLRYRFTHALIQQTLGDELTTSQRAATHAQIADELERWYGADAQLHAGELAHHLGEAPTAHPERLVQYCRIAGEQALAVHGYEEAAIQFERALAAKPVGALDDESAAILFGLGRAKAAALPLARMHEAVTVLRQACDYYVATGNVVKAIEIALLPYYPVTGQPTGQTEVILRALRLVPDESPEAARLLCRYGRLLALEDGDISGARTASQRALAIAERSGDATLAFRVLADVANVNLFDAASPDWLERISRALDGSEPRDPQTELVARYSAVQVSFMMGDPEAITHFGFPMLALAERLRDRFWLGSAHRVRAYVHWLLGDFAAARRESDFSLSAAPEEPRDLVVRIQVEYEAGNFGQGERYLDRLIKLREAGPPVANLEYLLAAFVVPLVAHLERSPRLLALAERVAELPFRMTESQRLIQFLHRGRALTAIIQNDRSLARESYAALSHDHHPEVPFCTLCRDRLLGLLAETFGDDVRASQHFEAALSLCQSRGLRPEFAWTSYDYAALLARATRHSDRARSADLLNQALAISRELGMRPLHERALALSQKTPVLAATPPAYPDGLTEREAEVLGLLAAGKPDRIIADELSISVRTVSNHVSSILGKTSSANRTEAATYALRHGLVARQPALRHRDQR